MALSTYFNTVAFWSTNVRLWLLLNSYYVLIQPWTELCCRQCKRKDSEKSQCHVMTFFFSTLKTEKRKVIRIQFVSENGFRMCIFIACHGIFCNLARVQTQIIQSFSDCDSPPMISPPRLWTENWASAQLSKSVLICSSLSKKESPFFTFGSFFLWKSWGTLNCHPYRWTFLLLWIT